MKRLTHELNFSDAVNALPQTKRCINPDCDHGYTPRSSGGVRVCPACDGRGFVGTVLENRRHYYLLRALTAELEIASRSRGGVIDQGSVTDYLNEIIGPEERMVAA